ncbi:MAG: energy-coupling factor transporter transmembrane protein EcfT, partial [Asgard group archaeon]|nr:energy-coupling factor transporter transmembrane protein EcfT [Asgard group archaeon]
SRHIEINPNLRRKLEFKVINVTFVYRSKNKRQNESTKLDPRTKLLMLFLMSLLSFMLKDIILLTSLFGIMIVITLPAKIKWKNFFRYIKPTIWLIPIIFIIQLIFPASNSGASIRLVTNFGFMSNSFKFQSIAINVESIVIASSSCLRILNLAVGSCLFSLTTNSNDYIQSLRKIAIPYGIAFTTGLVIYFLPMVVNETSETKMSLETRGISINKGSIISRIKNLYLLLTSILFNFIEKSRYQAIALDSRGFNPRKKRSYYQTIKLEFIDVSIMIFSIEFFCLMCFIFRSEIIFFFSLTQYFGQFGG